MHDDNVSRAVAESRARPVHDARDRDRVDEAGGVVAAIGMLVRPSFLTAFKRLHAIPDPPDRTGPAPLQATDPARRLLSAWGDGAVTLDER
jgi:hypothetical protein